MFGRDRPARRPVLLVLVFGAFLVLIGITASAQAAIVTSDVSGLAIKSVVDGDATAAGRFASQRLQRSDVTPGVAMDAGRSASLATELGYLLAPDGIQQVRLERADGTLVAAASRGTAAAAPTAPAPDQTGAAAGPPSARADASLLPLATSGAASDLPMTTVLRERLPITDANGQVLAVLTVWRDGAPILAQLDSLRFDILAVTLSAAFVAGVLLFFVFRAAQRRITRQTAELVEATRRDPLTGTLNHGALVSIVAERIDGVRSGRGIVEVALVDLDNFTLLNDNHGHRVGDTALLTVLEVLRDAVDPGSVIGRYGPDEFLVIAPAGEAAVLEPMLESVRTRLIERSLDVGAADRLPLTVSAGVAACPSDAESVTALLATVAATLAAAKASGGDEIRVASSTSRSAGVSSFDVLQGLVFAIDTKDRYTKRHSEDVARYATFLARRLGLDEATVDAVRTAGLLHDIGKIGMPDHLLRKPTALTDDEYEVVKQHVVLGDMIVRDVPGLDLVRAGIRHHHERWDGTGYVAGLAGESIPLVARIIAVADSFSAMTTSRAYRKALPVDEAVARMRASAGSQLDPRLVDAFLDGLLADADAPQPGVEARPGLWSSTAAVA